MSLDALLDGFCALALSTNSQINGGHIVFLVGLSTFESLV